VWGDSNPIGSRLERENWYEDIFLLSQSLTKQIVSMNKEGKHPAAKSMVSLASKSVLSEYWCYEKSEHRFGKLRVS
jgi:hypothetical protein